MTYFTEFIPAGVREGVPLVQHQCERSGEITYVSAVPSDPGDPCVVPGCGCRPLTEKEEKEEEEGE